MTIEIFKQENCDLESFTDVSADLERLPFDELPNLSTSLKIDALNKSLAVDWASDRSSMWLGREDETHTGFAVLKHLDWDSGILGVSCASLTLHLTSCTESSRKATASLLIHQALTHCRMENIQFLSTKIYSDRFAKMHALEDAGFRLMDAEMILRFSGNADAEAKVEGLEFSTKSQEEVPGLATMGKLFRLSRFFADPRISDEKAAEFWSASVKDSCLGHADSFLVAMANETAQGFVTFMDNLDFDALDGPSIRSFFHVGVAASAQGQGVGTALVRAATTASIEFDHILVETQSRNMAALSLYQKCGFRIIGSRFAFHLWLS
ncbi:MAG: GNAT superfamily N-acetyltransferase [Planctomycetota bacterium]